MIRMKTFLKIAAILAGLGVALLGAAAVAVHILLPPEKLKVLAVAQADKALHRKLEIQSIDFGLLSGLRIKGLRLSESPDFSKGEFLSADSFILSPAWLPLLHMEIVARKIELDGANVTVIKGNDGSFNFSNMTAAPPASAPRSPAPVKTASHAKPSKASPAPAPTAAAPIALAVNALRLENVTLHYTDKKQGAKADVKLADVKVDGFSLSGPFSVSLDVSADYTAAGKHYAGSFKTKGRVDLGGGDPSRLSADLSKFTLAAQGIELNGSLQFADSKSPKVSLNVALPALDTKTLNAAIGSALAPPGVELPAVKVEVKFAYADPSVEVSSFKLSASGGQILGSASVADINAKGPKLKASGSLSLDSLGGKYQGQTLEKLAGQIHFTQDSVDIPELTGRLNGGDFKLKLAASNPAAPLVTISGSMSLLDLGALQNLGGGPSPAPAKASAPAAKAASASTSSSATSSKPAPAAAPATQTAPKTAPYTGPVLKTSGDITVDKTTHPNFQCGKMTLTWNLTGVTPDLKRLDGVAKLAVGAGSVTNIIDFAKAKGGLVRVLVTPLDALQKAHSMHIPGLSVPDMQNISFNKITGDYKAAKGVISLQPFLFDSAAIGMTTTGTVDMGAQTANMKVSTKISGAQIDLAVTGPLSNLSVRPILSPQLQNTVNQLQNQGKALLHSFFGH